MAGLLKGFTAGKTGSRIPAPSTAAITLTGALDSVSVFGTAGTARMPIGVASSRAARLSGVLVSGTADAGITATGFREFATDLTGVTVADSGAGIVIKDANIVIFFSSVYDNAGAGISAQGTGGFNLSRSFVYGNGGAGVATVGAFSVFFEDNDIHHNADTGIEVSSSDQINLASNRIHENGAALASAGGIVLTGTRPPSFVGLAGNAVHANAGHQIVVDQTFGDPGPGPLWTLDGGDACDAPLLGATPLPAMTPAAPLAAWPSEDSHTSRRCGTRGRPPRRARAWTTSSRQPPPSMRPKRVRPSCA